MIQADLPISFRISKEQDMGYVVSNWSKTLRMQPEYIRIPFNIYKKNQGIVINNTLKHSQTYIGYLDNEPDDIVSHITYNVFDRDLIMHFVYVKSSWWRHGVMDQMIHDIRPTSSGQIITTTYHSNTHLRGFEKNFIDKYKPVYDPYFNMRFA